MNPSYAFIISGAGFTVRIEGDEHLKGSIIAAVIDATLGTGEDLNIRRELA